MIDAHTHLDACGATDADDRAAIVDRAAAAGVEASSPSPTTWTSAWVAGAAHWDPRVYAAVALHDARQRTHRRRQGRVERLAGTPARGRGRRDRLDLYWPGKLDGCADLPTQREAFAWHIDLAKRTGKPLMIHNRDADAEFSTCCAPRARPTR